MKHPAWTEPECQLLRELYPHHPTAAVAQRLGRPANTLYWQAYQLGLRKTAEYLASVHARHIQRGKQHPNMVAHQFQPGQTTWNKGVKGSTGLHPNCRPTQFKPGRAPNEAANYRPIGSLRISKDGYLERKFTDDPTLSPPRRWVGVHREVWEAAHGPIPAGHIVVFHPGAKTNAPNTIKPEHLECITRAEQASRNHPRSKSPELAKLVQLKGAITRQVNRISREAQGAAP